MPIFCDASQDEHLFPANQAICHKRYKKIILQQTSLDFVFLTSYYSFIDYLFLAIILLFGLYINVRYSLLGDEALED